MSKGRGQQGSEERSAAEDYDTLARTVFFPVYPVIANQILDRTGIDHGSCLDIGCGSGHLSVALATFSDLEVCAMDNSREMCRIAQATIRKYRLERRVCPVFGDVMEIPLPASSVDLVVSRGSLFLWKNLSRGFSECWRVLRPGGAVYAGEGYGNVRLRDEILAQMRERDPSWEEDQRRLHNNCSDRKIRSALALAGIHGYDLIRDDSGFWILF